MVVRYLSEKAQRRWVRPMAVGSRGAVRLDDRESGGPQAIGLISSLASEVHGDIIRVVVGCDKCGVCRRLDDIGGGCGCRMLTCMSSVCHGGQLHLFSVCGLED